MIVQYVGDGGVPTHPQNIDSPHGSISHPIRSNIFLYYSIQNQNTRKDKRFYISILYFGLFLCEIFKNMFSFDLSFGGVTSFGLKVSGNT